MKASNPVILVEFNELTPHLIERFIAAGRLPNFQRLRSESEAFITDAGEDSPNLEPWIQWVTVHNGVPFRDHGVFNLGDRAKSSYPFLWDIASKHGRSVWVCGSMNAEYLPGVKGAVLPDPWSVHVRPSNSEYNAYFEFVRAHVLEYTRDRVPLSRTAYLKFLWFMLTHGLSSSSVWATAIQLAEERLRGSRWKRVAILDRLQFDVFAHHFLRYQPDLSTFFLNSTAHLQHAYWRNMEPELFDLKPTSGQQRLYKDAVQFGYQQMDALLGKLLAIAGSTSSIVFATALSQQPCLKYESAGGKRFHKPRDHRRLLEFTGVDPTSCSYEPVMSEEFHLRFASSAAAEDALGRLLSLRIGSDPVIKAWREGSNLMAGCDVIREVGAGELASGPNGCIPFDTLFYAVDTTKSGMHHRDGLLWIRVPGREAAVHSERIPLECVAPTVLSLLGLTTPEYMSPIAPLGLPGQLVGTLAAC
jgi:hypothetical protein